MSTPTFKQKNVYAVYSTVWHAQIGIGTALLISLLTARLVLPRDSRPLPSRRVTREESRDCTGKYLTGRRLTSRLALWSIQLDADPQVLTGLLAMGMGEAAQPLGTNPSVHEITRIASDQLPDS